MKPALNIAIIGGGLMGLSTADSLTARGAKVTVFEKQGEVGHGAGRYNSGMIHPSQAKPWSIGQVEIDKIRTLVNWANQSRDLLMKRRRELGCNDVTRTPGTLQLFDSPLTRRNAYDFYNDIGVPVQKYEGQWAFGRDALKFSDDLSGNAYHYCQKLAADLQERGCVFRTRAEAEIVHKDGASFVNANDQLLSFDRIVVASGAASRKVLKPMGYELPVGPMRGHALVFDRPAGPLPEIPIMHAASHSALTVFNDHVRLSGSVGKDSPKSLIEIWENIAPDMINALGSPVVEWSADRPHSEVGQPIIGPTSIPDVWVNAGHGHMGWSLCSWSGEALAQQLLDGSKIQIAV